MSEIKREMTAPENDPLIAALEEDSPFGALIRLHVIAENDGEIVGEMGDSNSMQELAESGYFEYWENVMAESKQAKANVQ